MFAEADEFFQSGSKWADALRNSVESLAAYRFLIELEPDSMEYLLRAATVQMAGARAMAALDRVDDAAAEYAEILESLLRLELRDQANEEVAATLAQCFLDYGRLQLEMELLPSARAYLTESARRHARLAELHPDADDFRDRLIETHLYLADHAALRDDAADALTHSQRSLELSAERSPQVLLRLGTALRLNERYDEAAAILREASDAISDDPDSSPEVRDAIARELQLLRDRRE
jgi:tetratricopeptide (TPR) repeat protein